MTSIYEFTLHVAKLSAFITVVIFYSVLVEDVSCKLYHYTVATESNDGLKQFLYSASRENIPVKVLGLDSGIGRVDFSSSQTGAFKLKLLYEELERLKNELSQDKEKLQQCSSDNQEAHCNQETVSHMSSQNKQRDYEEANVIFTDGYDVIYLASSQAIEERFLSHGVDVLFGAEVFCWPDDELSEEYPSVDTPYKYLNSGGFIGKLSVLLELLSGVESLDDHADDQLYLTHAYLRSLQKKTISVALDSYATIFQNLNGAVKHLKLWSKTKRHLEKEANEGSEEDGFYEGGTNFEGDDANEVVTISLWNNVTKTRPLVLHANGPSKKQLNFFLVNYLVPQADVPNSNNLPANMMVDESLPNLEVVTVIEEPVPFLEQILGGILAQEYPLKKVHFNLFLSEASEAQRSTIEDKISSVKEIRKDIRVTIHENSNFCIQDQRCKYKEKIVGLLDALTNDENFQNSVTHAVVLDPIMSISNNKLLLLLATSKQDILAPVMSHELVMFSTFWGDISKNGYYKRSKDYRAIVRRKRLGMFNVPFVFGAYVLKQHRLIELRDLWKVCENDEIDSADDEVLMAFCLRNNGIFMYAMNQEHYGHVIFARDYDPSTPNSEIFLFANAPMLWKNVYLDMESYSKLQSTTVLSGFETPCPEVYRMKIFNERFTKELVEIAETANQWSGGGHKSAKDERYGDNFVESYPTVDVHLYQIKFNGTWLDIMHHIIVPLLEVIYPDFNFLFEEEDGRPGFMFIVRYRPDEQAYLRPHHDASIYTLNVALNTAGKDFEGGGCRFIRQDCAVTDTKAGEVMVHPGKLTHWHEGLTTTGGTRYILISFMQP